MPGADIHIVTVAMSDFNNIASRLDVYTAQLIKHLNKFGIEHQVGHLKGDNITDTIIDYAKKEKVFLISVMTELEKSLSNILLGSIVHQMINKSPLPLLFFQQGNLE